MTFYPVEFWGIKIWQPKDQPLGCIGWQVTASNAKAARHDRQHSTALYKRRGFFVFVCFGSTLARSVKLKTQHTCVFVFVFVFFLFAGRSGRSTPAPRIVSFRDDACLAFGAEPYPRKWCRLPHSYTAFGDSRDAVRVQT